ncbi:hypothetical protein BC835DRAFT_1415915 [Cytidiella melzeri]|nr:hypothetical protein BC835DRAFT_1415915 [Cytidiella melzeri]
MDLMQEHNINLLKFMSGSRSSPFADPFFKEVISLNIHNFSDIKESLHMAVGIGAKSGSHKQKKKAVALRHLRNTMHKHELHKLEQAGPLDSWLKTTLQQDMTTLTTLLTLRTLYNGLSQTWVICMVLKKWTMRMLSKQTLMLRDPVYGKTVNWYWL